MGKAEAVAEAEYEQDVSQFLLKVAAQIAIVCASTMAFFHLYSSDIYVATLCFVGGAILGSLACWKNVQAARVLLFASALITEWVIVQRLSASLLPFFAIGDLFLLVFLGYGFVKEMQRSK